MEIWKGLKKIEKEYYILHLRKRKSEQTYMERVRASTMIGPNNQKLMRGLRMLTVKTNWTLLRCQHDLFLCSMKKI